ncbi:DUF2339 domain-containing protein [Kaistia dalseonensis]|uniref:Membrane protein n=1 Tax=Kaistia dalseonensis TaxID=410840 RepID=A0ABU0H1N0_9HYPH|nr:DUF2339 domain-containing protein [Kaistia dalseonensis]MCX5493657.1 DUF2339 domain-containing protein [Kaistia dalseonensis]MDQ0436219.1 putative membrane protein [Kaistia dalseonensis]
MDGLISLGLLLIVALPVMLIASFVMGIKAHRRITALEARLAALDGRSLVAVQPPVGPDVSPETPVAIVAPAVEAETVPASEPVPEPESLLPPDEPASAAGPSVARPKESLEQRLGTRWAVWVGGLALALGAIFLVRYSIDAGLLGPGVRIAFGAAFSLALLAAGEWLRRSDRVTAFSAIPSANIPGILTAAGTVGLFATAYGAYALYGLIGPTAAFVLLALISLGTMAAAALHGPWLSGLGLVGAYAAPLLVGSDAPDIAMLMSYLTLVTAAAYGLARLRQWRWLAIAAGIGAVGWGFLLLTSPAAPIESGIYAVVMLVLAAFFLIIDVQRDSEPSGRPDWLAVGVVWAIAALLVAGAMASDYETASIIASLIGGAILLVIAWRYDAVALASPGAAGLALALLYFWPAARQAAAEPTTQIIDAVSAYLPLPDAINAFAAVAAASAAALIATALARLRTTPEPGRFAISAHAAAATAGPLLIAIVAYLRITGFVSNVSFAALTLALGFLYAVLTERFARRERADAPSDQIPTGLFAAGAVGAVALSLTMALEGGVLTTSFALASLGAAWVQLRRPITALRYAVGVLALLTLARVAWDPYIFGTRSGSGIYLSILFGYGIPAAAFAGASTLLRRVREDRAVHAAEALAVIMAALLVIFEIRAFTFGGDLLKPSTALSEQGLTTVAAFAFALGLSRLSQSRPSPVFRIGAVLARLLGLTNAVLALGFVVNPILTGIAVAGGAIFNEILLAYALPAILAALIAASPLPAAARPVQRWLRSATGLVAFALAFSAISLEIRFLFAQAPDLTVDSIGSAESYTYSAAWLVLGLALLLVGLVFDMKAARLASAALILLTVLKVFLVDMANLEGVWRAFSFMGLGIVLIGIGLLYQRLLFGHGGSRAEPASEGTGQTP